MMKVIFCCLSFSYVLFSQELGVALSGLDARQLIKVMDKLVRSVKSEKTIRWDFQASAPTLQMTCQAKLNAYVQSSAQCSVIVNSSVASTKDIAVTWSDKFINTVKVEISGNLQKSFKESFNERGYVSRQMRKLVQKNAGQTSTEVLPALTVFCKAASCTLNLVSEAY
jgi:hypothetical protein